MMFYWSIINHMMWYKNAWLRMRAWHNAQRSSVKWVLFTHVHYLDRCHRWSISSALYVFEKWVKQVTKLSFGLLVLHHGCGKLTGRAVYHASRLDLMLSFYRKVVVLKKSNGNTAFDWGVGSVQYAVIPQQSDSPFLCEKKYIYS